MVSGSGKVGSLGLRGEPGCERPDHSVGLGCRIGLNEAVGEGQPELESAVSGKENEEEEKGRAGADLYCLVASDGPGSG